MTHLASLDHPNVVRLYEWFRLPDDSLILVQELCTGGTIETRMTQRGGRFELDETAFNLRMVLRSLLACHSVGLIHRDVKTINFVYTSPDPNATLKLIDFGMARRVEKEGVARAVLMTQAWFVGVGISKL